MKKNNKGFSLVELIVVVAIMAVLVGVLAPSLLSYVEKSRAQKDASAAEEVRNAVVLAMADENVFAEVKNNDTITIAADGTYDYSGSHDNLDAELQKVVPTGSAKFTSATHKEQVYVITIKIEATGAVKAEGTFAEK